MAIKELVQSKCCSAAPAELVFPDQKSDRPKYLLMAGKSVDLFSTLGSGKTTIVNIYCSRIPTWDFLSPRPHAISAAVPRPTKRLLFPHTRRVQKEDR